MLEWAEAEHSRQLMVGVAVLPVQWLLIYLTHRLFTITSGWNKLHATWLWLSRQQGLTDL